MAMAFHNRLQVFFCYSLITTNTQSWSVPTPSATQPRWRLLCPVFCFKCTSWVTKLHHVFLYCTYAFKILSVNVCDLKHSINVLLVTYQLKDSHSQCEQRKMSAVWEDVELSRLLSSHQTAHLRTQGDWEWNVFLKNKFLFSLWLYCHTPCVLHGMQDIISSLKHLCLWECRHSRSEQDNWGSLKTNL